MYGKLDIKINAIDTSGFILKRALPKSAMSHYEPLIFTVYKIRNHFLHSHVIRSCRRSQWFKSCSQTNRSNLI